VGPVGPPPKIDLSYFNFSSTDQAFLMMKILKTRLRKNKTMNAQKKKNEDFFAILKFKKKKKKKKSVVVYIEKEFVNNFLILDDFSSLKECSLQF